ncbi:MAG: hypothetical protein WD691_10115 [Acidimicrobiales bacterium]
MRARRGLILGWTVIAAYTGLLGWASIDAVDSSGRADRAEVEAGAPSRFIDAWQRSREATFVAVGTYERQSRVSGALLSSEDVVAQKPPRRLHRQMGGVEGQDDGRLIVCPAPPAGEEERRAPCQLGAPSGVTYSDSVQREVAGLRSILLGDVPLYIVREPTPGCFDLVQRRIDPRAPFGVRASFCFDAVSGAVRTSRVHHAGGIVEIVVVTTIRADVTADDLVP